MAKWNQSTWNSGALWGPAPEPLPYANQTKTKKNKTMKRQNYFPTRRVEEPEWFANFADKLATYETELGIVALTLAARVNDARFSGYSAGLWLAQSRAFAPACTSALDGLYTGTGTAPFVLPGFVAPPLPAGVTPVPPGALARLFDFIAIIKRAPGYTEAIGLDLRIVGPEQPPPSALPVFTVAAVTGTACQCVRISFKKYGNMGVVVESRRGTGDWEVLIIATKSPWLDGRPLLVPTAPEIREYRLRFWQDGEAVGDYTDVAKVTVSPA